MHSFNLSTTHQGRTVSQERCIILSHEPSPCKPQSAFSKETVALLQLDLTMHLGQSLVTPGISALMLNACVMCCGLANGQKLMQKVVLPNGVPK